jgi:hypothetical protein
MLLLWPLFGVFFAAVCHVAAVRLSPRRSEWGHLLLGVALGAVYVWSATLVSLGLGDSMTQLVAALILNTLSYLGLVYIYADFNNANFTALRLRVLRECQASPGGLTTEQLASRYDVPSLVTHRLDKYVQQGFLVRSDETYRIGKPTIVWVCRCYQLMYRILFGKPMPMAGNPGGAERTVTS